MHGDKTFLDTNLFVYLYSDSDLAKKATVIETLNLYERFVSTQVLNEFCNVAIRKLHLSSLDVQKAVDEICNNCNLILVDDSTIRLALKYHEKYRFSYFDSLMIASAMECGCSYLFSEDMSNGQVIEKVLTIKNIFS